MKLAELRDQNLFSTLAEAEPLAWCSSSASPPPSLHPAPPSSLPHSLSPTSLHIVLLPISLSVINYKRHKPPGLMPRCGCLPSCTFSRAKRPASLITPGTLSGSPLAVWQRSPNGPFTVPKDTSAFFFFSCFLSTNQLMEPTSLSLQRWKCFVLGGHVRHINNER